MNHYLIGLSLSQCTEDWIKNIISLDQIKCIFAGTAIDPHSLVQIDEWIEMESRINPTIRSRPEDAKNFINQLIKYGQLIQPRLMNNRMKPIYRGGNHWIHKDRFIDWMNYQTTNQCCPYCGTINQFMDITIESMHENGYSKLSCNQCFNEWKIPYEIKWESYERTDWMNPKTISS